MGQLLAIAVLACVGGCLYTDPINMPPRVEIQAAGDIWRNQAPTFTARISDPNGDSVTLDWGLTTCVKDPTVATASCAPCPVGANEYLSPDRWPKTLFRQQSYTVDKADTLQPFCVWAFATDSQGARQVAVPLAVNPMNHPPVAAIRVVKPAVTIADSALSLYSEIELSGDLSVDAEGDPTTFAWTLVRKPASSLLDPSTLSGSCSMPSTSSSWCLTPDEPGSYAVQLGVQDAYAGSSAPGPTAAALGPSLVTRELVVAPDRLPCLSLVTPGAAVLSGLDPTEDQILAVVRVDDDLDRYPADTSTPTPPTGAGMLHFRWFKGRKSEPLEYVGNDVAQFTVHRLDYSSTDDVVVRVEIFDRNQDLIEQILGACGTDRDVCGETVGQSVCNQRMTWNLRYY